MTGTFCKRKHAKDLAKRVCQGSRSVCVAVSDHIPTDFNNGSGLPSAVLVCLASTWFRRSRTWVRFRRTNDIQAPRYTTRLTHAALAVQTVWAAVPTQPGSNARPPRSISQRLACHRVPVVAAMVLVQWEAAARRRRA